MMRKYIRIILCFLFALHVVPIHSSAEEYDLLINGAKDEEEMYALLLEHEGHEILEEYIMLENEGVSELIPYACALADKADEFTEEEIIQLILEERTHGETESVLVEMLQRKNTDFNKLTYIQEDESVALNTKQLLLQSDSISLDYLVSCVYRCEDFRAEIAMQQIGFRDKAYAFELSKDLLFNYDNSYYRMAAINVGMDLYYQNYPEEQKDKNDIAEKLMDIYQTSEDEQIRFWAIDTLSWMQDWDIFIRVNKLEDLSISDKYLLYDNMRETVLSRASSLIEDDVYYLTEYYSLIGDETVKEILIQNGYEISDISETESVSSLSSYAGYAVYRGGVFGGLADHAAIMNLDQVDNTSTNVVFHAPGSGNTTTASWSTFKNGSYFISACKPKNCSMSSLQYAFRNKALALTGKPYVIVRQMDYNLLNDGSLIEPSIITKLRCDGVVEYVYEYYGYRVGGSINAWNIAINYSANRDAHASASVTPSTQRTLFLDVVTTTESDLY